jgi:hypothetical protein
LFHFSEYFFEPVERLLISCTPGENVSERRIFLQLCSGRKQPLTAAVPAGQDDNDPVASGGWKQVCFLISQPYCYHFAVSVIYA